MPAKKKPAACDAIRLEIEDLKDRLAVAIARIAVLERKLAAPPVEEKRAKWFGW